MKNYIFIYNLFPLLFGNIQKWIKYIPEIKNMGFNYIYINPFHYPGFSGSLYAPKDYFKINPIFGDDIQEIKKFIDVSHKNSIKVIMDLVVNHTAKDSPLTIEHNDWYQKKENKTIKSPGAWNNGNFIEWGDLALIDNANSPSKKYLWKYWLDMMLYYLHMGFDGFRCDAAYQVPTELWNYLISETKKQYPDIIFLAETLGCKVEDIISLNNSGFDYSFSSARWWDFKENWFIKQYNETANTVSYISFPESHDTERAFGKYSLNEFYQKLYFSAFFSTAWMITSGFEYGFKKRLNVVHTRHTDWESMNIDLREKIKFINKVKKKYKIFNIDTPVKWIQENNITVIIKKIENKIAYFIINIENKKNQINIKKYLKNEFIYNILLDREEKSNTYENFELDTKGIVILYEEII